LVTCLILSVASAAAGGAREKPGASKSSDYAGPDILNLATGLTIRYPVFAVSGWSIKSVSYGWLDITRTGTLRYSVVQPDTKKQEGFESPAPDSAEVSEGMLNLRYRFVYLPQDRWGTIRTGISAAGAKRKWGRVLARWRQH
jgi:hypothetical protein